IGGAVADPLEAASSGHDMGQQNRFDAVAQSTIRVADDAGAGTEVATFAVGGDGGDELGFTDRPHFLRTILAIGRAALDEHGGANVVPGSHVLRQFVEQITIGTCVPQMMLRIDDGLVGIQNVLSQAGEPRGPDTRMRKPKPAAAHGTCPPPGWVPRFGRIRPWRGSPRNPRPDRRRVRVAALPPAASALVAAP